MRPHPPKGKHLLVPNKTRSPKRASASKRAPVSKKVRASKKASGPKKKGPAPAKKAVKKTIQRVQTGVRIEKSMLKVLKSLAEYLDMSLGDLLEGIVLHAFEGKGALEGRTLDVVKDLKKIYGMDYSSEMAHQMIEE